MAWLAGKCEIIFDPGLTCENSVSLVGTYTHFQSRIYISRDHVKGTVGNLFSAEFTLKMLLCVFLDYRE